MFLLILCLFIGNTYCAPNKERPGKRHRRRSSQNKTKIYDWDFTVFGHRGGIAGFVPQHSSISFTIGAQNGADYLEPDITFTSDGIQIIRHHPDLSERTNVNDIYDTNSIKYTPPNTIEYYWRTENEGGPSTHPYLKETSGGYFSWDFTFSETQNLSLLSNLQPSPFDTFNLKVMKFEELLILIKDTLIPTLNRPIGIIPELKYHHEFTNRLGINVELLHLQLLAKYGYLKYDAINDYYEVVTLCDYVYNIGLTECNEILYGNKPSVIIQSFNAPSLKIFRNYTNAPLIYLGWYDYDYDIPNVEFVSWVKTFADGLGLNTPGVSVLAETLKDMDNMDDFVIYEYTLDADVNKYFDLINNGFDGVWTDNVETAKAVQETLDYMKENNVKIKSKGNSYAALFNDEMNSNSDVDNVDTVDNGNVDCKPMIDFNELIMIIFVVLFIAFVLNVLGCFWYHRKYSKLNVSYVPVDGTSQLNIDEN